MDASVENVFVVAAALPGLYGFICWVRRSINAQRAARWVQKTHSDEWNELHWLAKRNCWAGVEVLIKKGLISGTEVNEFRVRDESLERATWVGLFISAVLLLVLVVLKGVVAVFD
jgi:hypothetical protein